ncbi:MAG TPA: MlaD family protein [Solirubrobacterales bacterium]|nr:MlaD family protein [Solirubrobacterales bacterium]
MVIACAVAGGIGLLVAGPAASDDGGPYELRAIFDNASFLVPGEEVRIAGAKVGEVAEVDVTRPGETVSLENGPEDEPGKAAVVLRIDEPGFQDFREDASCLVQPQSLLGEKFVGCRPTQPRAPGTEPPPPLEEVADGQPGEGQLLLPLENNGKAVDIDLVNNIMREPYADRFRLILNDLGAGFAARGDELEELVERSNPALRQTNRVLEILAAQNRALAELARDSDTVLTPLARERSRITGFMRGSTVAAQATAERADDLEAGFELFPEYLRQLRATSRDLRRFSDAGTPVVTDFGDSAPDVTRAQKALAPLADAGTDALTTLGDAAEASQDDIVASDPVIKDVRDLSRSAKPGANQLDKLLASLDQEICVQRNFEGVCDVETTGLRSLMDFFFGTSAAVNGFDQYGHYLRTFGLVTNCTVIFAINIGECDAHFGEGPDLERASAADLDSGDERRGSKTRGREGSVSAEPRAPAGGEPAQPQSESPDDEATPGGSEGEVAPEPSSSERAGRELLRFLLEDGS